MQYHIAIIGGGAAGLMAACAAAMESGGIRIAVIEQQQRVGKKILATGNGRCNLSNISMDLGHFHTQDPEILAKILANCSQENTLAYFSRLGLRTAIEDGRIYPESRQASAVLDVLRFGALYRGVEILTDIPVTNLEHVTEGFVVHTRQGTPIYAKRVVVATGGLAAVGSNLAYDWLKALGHKSCATFPALVPLTAKHPFPQLKGVRVHAKLSLHQGGREQAADTGEVQFTAYGLSGIPAMQVSNKYQSEIPDALAILDLVPNQSESDLTAEIRERQRMLAPQSDLFVGWLHKHIAAEVQKAAGHNKDDPAGLAHALKNWAIPLKGTRGFEHAQTTGGGIRLSDFDPANMESRRVPGLFVAGELLDVYGDCGGYNLQWAWSTGILAGKGAAER